jgi:hypothetical protein
LYFLLDQKVPKTQERLKLASPQGKAARQSFGPPRKKNTEEFFLI